MKTRIIQTRFWEDDQVEECSLYGQHLWIYLLSCPYINMGGMFKLKDMIITDQAKLTPVQLKQAKAELERAGKVYFKDNWVWVVNALKQNNYINAPKNLIAYEREKAQIPENIKSYFNSLTKPNDTTIPSTPDSTRHSNHKSEIINHKSEIINTGGDFKKFLEKFNELYQKNYQETSGRLTKYKTRLKTYSGEQLLLALENMAKIPFYQGQNDRGWMPDPDYILRSDEIIDRLLNQKQGHKKAFASENTDRFAGL